MSAHSIHIRRQDFLRDTSGHTLSSNHILMNIVRIPTKINCRTLIVIAKRNCKSVLIIELFHVVQDGWFKSAMIFLTSLAKDVTKPIRYNNIDQKRNIFFGTNNSSKISNNWYQNMSFLCMLDKDSKITIIQRLGQGRFILLFLLHCNTSEYAVARCGSVA